MNLKLKKKWRKPVLKSLGISKTYKAGLEVDGLYGSGTTS